MPRIVTTPFTLNSGEGEKLQFAVGDQIKGKLEEHWYVKAHTEELTAKGAKKQPEQKAETEPTKAPEGNPATTEEAKQD